MSKQNTMGSVTLVGAGCGPDLITVAGLRALQAADVIVYDDLLDKGLLEELGHSQSTPRADANSRPVESNSDEREADATKPELIYVGKRRGQHSETQENINALLVELAQSGKNVVRLKGGDSFVFGRGGEEILALQEAGIPYSVIPGISSAIAVPEHAGIPVTHRGVARSFTVVTGHTAVSKENPPSDSRDSSKPGTKAVTNTVGGEDYSALAKLQGTLVFLMGLHNIAEITAKLIENGKDPATPAAVLSQGYSENEARIDGTLETIAGLSKEQNAQPPAILVVGDVAGFDFRETANKFAITAPASLEQHSDSETPRARERAQGIEATGATTAIDSISVIGTEGFCERFRAACSNAVTYPVVSIEPLDDAQAYVKSSLPQKETTDTCFATNGKHLQTSQLSDAYTWLGFLSANAMDLFFEQVEDHRSLANFKFSCVGVATQKALQKHGFQADFIPSQFDRETLIKELEAILTEGEKVLLLGALEQNLSAEVPHKQAVPSADAVTEIGRRQTLIEPHPLTEHFDLLPLYQTTVQPIPISVTTKYTVFASSSGVRGFFENGGTLGRAIPVAIGKATAAELEERGYEVLIARPHTIDGILDTIRRAEAGTGESI